MNLLEIIRTRFKLAEVCFSINNLRKKCLKNLLEIPNLMHPFILNSLVVSSTVSDMQEMFVVTQF